MRMLIAFILLGFLVPFTGQAITGPSSRFEYLMNGKITANQVSTCSGEATARFDFAFGKASVVHYAGATCTAAPSGFITPVNSIIWINED